MSIIANIATNINEKQTDNFYFIISFDLPDGASFADDGFTLSNLEISGTTDISISDFVLIDLENEYAIIAVDLPSLLTGKFDLDVTGNATIVTAGVSSEQELVGSTKTIEYDTTGERSGITYDTTPTSSEPTIVTMELSAASADNGGVIVAQFDFDFGVAYFSSAYVNVMPSTAVKGTAYSIGDNFERWIMLITLPLSGSGMVDISIDEDAIGFPHDALQAQVQHQQNTRLTIDGVPAPIDLTEDVDVLGTRTGDIAIPNPTIGHDFLYEIFITGNNVNKVDVHGILAPFIHTWNKTTGKLSVQSYGKVESDYEDFNFFVTAYDDTITAGFTRRGVLNSPDPVAPAIIQPASPLELFFGKENEVSVEIRNIPSKGTVSGTWMGNLKPNFTRTGVSIQGEIPEKGTTTGKALPGVNSGKFLITAENDGGPAIPEEVDWVLRDVVKPQFGGPVFSTSIEINTGLTDTIMVTASPEPTIEIESGELPEGLALEITRTVGVTTVSFSGTATEVGTFRFKLKATNSEGVTISSEYTITVAQVFGAPTARNPIGTRLSWFRDTLLNRGYNLREYFNLGTPEGTFSISGTNAQYYSITPAGLLTATEGIRSFSVLDPVPITVTVTNVRGSLQRVFPIVLLF